MATPTRHSDVPKPSTFEGSFRGADHLNPNEAMTGASVRTRDAYMALIDAKARGSVPADKVDELEEEAYQARTQLVTAISRRTSSVGYAAAQLSDHAFEPIRDAVDQIYGRIADDPGDSAVKKIGKRAVRFLSAETLYSDTMIKDFQLYPDQLEHVIDNQRPDVHGLPDAMQATVALKYGEIMDWLKPEAPVTEVQ